MCLEKLFKKEKKLRLIKTDNFRGKTICQLIFGICGLRTEQLERFERITRRLRKKQRKINFPKIKTRIEALNEIGFKKNKAKLEVKNREELFKKIRILLEGRQKREEEKEFKKIRRRLEKNSRYFRELELEIRQRKQKLRGRSKCTFLVLCEYIRKYEKLKSQ